MLPAIPKNCTVIETSLSHYVPVDDIGTVEERPVFRCIPKLESNVIRLYALGNTSKVSYRPVCIAPGMSANPTITGNLLIHTFHCRLKSHSWKRFWDYDTFVV